ncbi:hypothetical protein D9M68_746320 [compost metagenome]
MRNRVGGRQDLAAVLGGAGGQRCVFAYRRQPVPQQHGLEDRIAIVGAQGVADQPRERLEEGVPDRRRGRVAPGHGLTGAFDGAGQRRRGRGAVSGKVAEGGDAVAARDGA